MQLLELRGLIKIVPPLIDADRLRRWEEASYGIGPDDEPIDIYESDAGEEEGYGHADYARTLYSTAIVTAWDIFHVYRARLLEEHVLRYRLDDYTTLSRLVFEERRSWDRQFEKIEGRYNDFAKIEIRKLPEWEQIRHARELRNALVYNLGEHTQRYLELKQARRPSIDDDTYFGMHLPMADQEFLTGHPIPLDLAFSDMLITNLLRAGEAVNKPLNPEIATSAPEG